jgi:pimeloyl-ACP methyl ester carboxylesterase
VTRRPVRFFSDGIALDGDLYFAPGGRAGDRRPALVACSGYQGLKDLHPARFARGLVPSGYACLAFDYRGFGASGGVRGRLVPQEQVEDVRAALSFLETVPEVDPERIGLVGWGLGGGVAIAAAADDPRARAVAAVNAVGDAERSARSLHDEASWRDLVASLADDRRVRATTGSSRLVPTFDVVRLDEATRGYVDGELRKAPGFGTDVTLEATDLLFRFRPERVVERIAPRPLLLVHGADNRLHPPAEAEELFRRAEEPKELVVLEGAGHTEWMHDDHPIFERLVAVLRAFFVRALELEGALR